MILISPWSRITTEGKPSPKNYPHWQMVVLGLKNAGHELVQVSCKNEPDVWGCRRVDDVPLDKLADLMKLCATWISVDNFWHHMAWTIGEPGVVIFGCSDPIIFGHPENTNLLKDRKYLRTRQFGLWSQENPNPEAFVGPEIVIQAALSSAEKRNVRRLKPFLINGNR